MSHNNRRYRFFAVCLFFLITSIFIFKETTRASIAQTATSNGWLATGDPEVSFVDLPASYVIPPGDKYNTDCDTTNFDVVSLPKKTITAWPFIQEEQHYKSSCAIYTPRGLTDGIYLDSGDPAGKFTTSNGVNQIIQRVPNSNILMTFKTVINGVSLEPSFYNSIVPDYNQSTGAVQFRLSPETPQKLTDASGKTYFIRPGSVGYSKNGLWMIAESDRGMIRVDLQSRKVLPFAPNIRDASGSGPDQHVAISDDGKYAAVSAGGFLFKVYDLSTCSEVPDLVTGPVVCQYKDVQAKLTSLMPGYKMSVHIRFSSDNLLTLIGIYPDSSGVNKKASVRIAPNGVAIEDVGYLALGDSFSSGEGAYDYETGTDSPENKCHLSKKSYPYLASQTLGINNFHSVACSGAKLINYTIYPQAENLPLEVYDSNWFAGSISQKKFVINALPNVVTVSMVGNDVGFNDKITKCVLGTDSCFHFKEDRQSVAEEIISKFNDLVNLYADIKTSSGNPNVKVYVMGYPNLFSISGECGLNVRLDAEEREFSRGLVGFLDATIKAATEKAGVQYINVENAFAGKEHCDPGTEKAVNGLTNGNDILKVLGNESFHPNQAGHQLFNQVLLAQSERFTKEMPAADPTKTPPSEGSDEYLALIGAALNGGRVSRLRYTTLEGVELIYKNAPFIPKVPDVSFSPNDTFESWLNSDPVFVGELKTDETGKLQGSIVIPGSVDPGYHTLHVYAKNLSGEDIDVYKTIYIAESTSDYDGDGIPNSEEACLAVSPANLDYDRDGIDDACDDFIGEPPQDITPPEVTPKPDRAPDLGDWYNHDVQINWLTTDPEPSSGEPSIPKSLTVSSEGINDYESSPSCDPSKNCSTGSIKVSLDKTAPVITQFSTSESHLSEGDSLVVDFEADDATSGIHKAEYYIGGIDPGYGLGMPADYNGSNFHFVVGENLKPGLYELNVRVADKAGNWSTEKKIAVTVIGKQTVKVFGRGVIFENSLNRSFNFARFSLNVSFDGTDATGQFEFSEVSSPFCNLFWFIKTCNDLVLKASEIKSVSATGNVFSISGSGDLWQEGKKTRIEFMLSGEERSFSFFHKKQSLELSIFKENQQLSAPIYHIKSDNILGRYKINLN